MKEFFVRKVKANAEGEYMLWRSPWIFSVTKKLDFFSLLHFQINCQIISLLQLVKINAIPRTLSPFAKIYRFESRPKKAIVFSVVGSYRDPTRYLLGKVHDFPGLGVHGDSAGQRCGRAILWSPWDMRALAGIVLLLDQMVPGAERYQMSIVGRSRNWHGSGTSDIGVT